MAGDVDVVPVKGGPDISSVVRAIMAVGLQDFGQSFEERAAAWQSAMNFVGLDCKVSVADKDCSLVIYAEGPDEEKGNQLICEILDQYPIGKFELEREMVKGVLGKYKKHN